MKTKPSARWIPIVGILLLANSAGNLSAQGTAFTYQGRLTDSGSPASGSYDFRVRLASDALGNNFVAGPLFSNSVPVSSGLFLLKLDFGAGVFAGSNYWLQVDVKTNNAGSYTTLAPLQALTPTPYAIFANSASNISGTLPAAQLSGALPGAQLLGTYSGAVTLNNGANSFSGAFSGNGGGLTNLNVATLGGLSASNFWQLGGNNVAAGQFLGSTNNQTVDIKVRGSSALRLQPSTNDAPNIVGGAPGNLVASNVVGSTIGGGGSTNYSGANNSTNFIGADFSVVGGGASNRIEAGARNSSLGGGLANVIQVPFSSIGGGSGNLIAAGTFTTSAVIGGGSDNTVSTLNGTVGGGSGNVIGGTPPIDYGSIFFNVGQYATIAGGAGNFVALNSPGSSIGGGINNFVVSGESSTIGGGLKNTIQSNGSYATIAGGRANTIQTNAIESTISGGSANTIQTGVQQASIGGGKGNTIQGINYYATIGGGYNNTIFSGADSSTINGGNGNNISLSAAGATIGGGLNNLIENGTFGFGNNFTTIGGGYGNMIQSSAYSATIAGGWGNRIAFGGEYSFIGGGTLNTNTGEYATIPGGSANVAANFSFAAGFKAKAVHDSTFVWADGQGVDFSSTAVNQFLIRAAGGVGINANNPAGAALAVVGGIRAGVNGTVQSRVQFGTATVGTGTNGVNTFIITFPTAFAAVPKVFVTAKGNDNPDTFAISTRAVTAANFKVNIVRIDIAAGWGQPLQVDWYAVE